MRKSKRHTELIDVHTDSAPGPDRRAETGQELSRVREVLATLPEISRAAFIMRVQHGMPYEEIARALEMPLATAKVKVHRVRKKLLMERIEREGPASWKSTET